MSQSLNRVRVPDLIRKKQRREKIAILTAYDATMARLLDQAGIDALLVGDSLATVILGYGSTIPVTLDAMIHHTRAVVQGTSRALVIADLPFLTYQVSLEDAVRNAGRLVQEGGAAAVKLEGGEVMADRVHRLSEIGIAVMGHIGLTPQSEHKLGGYRVVGKTEQEATRLLREARILEQAGAFAVVLECVPADVAASITAELKIPTIGIGAGPDCDGQVLVSYDALGLFDQFQPGFVKRYAHLAQEVAAAAKDYIADVREGRFPAAEHCVGAVSEKTR